MFNLPAGNSCTLTIEGSRLSFVSSDNLVLPPLLLEDVPDPIFVLVVVFWSAFSSIHGFCSIYFVYLILIRTIDL